MTEKSDRKRAPRAPAQMVRPRVVARPPGLPTEDIAGSPLAAYLKLNSLSPTSFARAMGIDYRTVREWLSGSSVPEFAYLLEIERVTKGVVAMETWAGVAKVKQQILHIRSKQLSQMEELKNENEPGGFAQPMHGDPRRPGNFKKGMRPRNKVKDPDSDAGGEVEPSDGDL